MFVFSQLNIVQTQINDGYTDINKLKQERQNLLGFIHTLESDIKDLKRQISGLEKMSQDQVTFHYFIYIHYFLFQTLKKLLNDEGVFYTDIVKVLSW